MSGLRSTPPGKTTCLCGKTEFVAVGALVVTSLRCPLCPPEHPKPQLRLVK